MPAQGRRFSQHRCPAPVSVTPRRTRRHRPTPHPTSRKGHRRVQHFAPRPSSRSSGATCGGCRLGPAGGGRARAGPRLGHGRPRPRFSRHRRRRLRLVRQLRAGPGTRRDLVHRCRTTGTGPRSPLPGHRLARGGCAGSHGARMAAVPQRRDRRPGPVGGDRSGHPPPGRRPLSLRTARPVSTSPVGPGRFRRSRGRDLEPGARVRARRAGSRRVANPVPSGVDAPGAEARSARRGSSSGGRRPGCRRRRSAGRLPGHR